MKRILIADDHDAVRAGVRAVLEGRPGWEIVAEARNGKEAISCAIQAQPDVAIIDYSMPFMTGIEVAKQIRERKLVTEVLIFTMHDSVALQLQASEVGARGFVRKSDANKMLLVAVESLMHHKSYYAGKAYGENAAAEDRMECTGPSLSPRETTIVKLIAEGYSNKHISAALGVSVKTTETHRAAAMRKLNIHSTAGLVRYAVKANLIEA
ncbi:response regulator transcription factor [Tardiphaga sp. 709]|uniref:response regulator transcription factor n=1 Tax=Tardiphaga sp. 709 TaxID=3076039 RepID=UPI0028EAD88E|nr:response regulator transcription factor [Tardiphaga sp. 709]WNV12819.1 response regulator transcription factor [Tardiphaga sp. 709]